MSDECRRLLEASLTAQVLILSRQIDQEKRDGGTKRLGGDYTHEAIALIRQKQGRIIEMLQS